MLTGSSRLRDWGLFFAAALLPAMAMGLFALRALRGEEVAVREQMRLALEHAAEACENRWQEELAALRADPARWSESPIAEVVELEAEAERARAAPDPRCEGLDEAVRRGEAEAKRQVLEACPVARTGSGRMLWPLVALARDAGTASERLEGWLRAHGGALDVPEREAVRREIDQASWLGEDERARVIAALDAGGAASAQRLAQSRRFAVLADQPTIDWTDARSSGHLRRQPDGRYRGFVVHAGSIARALAGGWPALDGDMAAELVVAASAPEGPSVTLLPGAHLIIDWRDPNAVAHQTARSKRLLAGAAALAMLVAIALAGWLFARMRAERRLSALRTDFVAAVSHELRTPIASLRMLSELLAEGRVEAGEREEVHRALAGEARRLGETVDRLLGFSRMEAGKLSARRERVAVAKVVEDAVAPFLARHPEAEVEVRIDADLEAEIDRESVAMALSNLLANAHKYAPEGQPYAIHVRRRKGVEIAVSDRGPGIARGDQARIFRPFERAADKLSEATEGSGIGLSLVAHVARSHGGRVRVESEIGRGATFILWFPEAAR